MSATANRSEGVYNRAGERSETFCGKEEQRHRLVCVRQYYAEIDEAARNRMELIVPELAKRNSVTEKLKAENQMKWVRQMNTCKTQAEAIVKLELIYD